MIPHVRSVLGRLGRQVRAPLGLSARPVRVWHRDPRIPSWSHRYTCWVGALACSEQRLQRPLGSLLQKMCKRGLSMPSATRSSPLETVPVPTMGESITEGTLVALLKHVGDAVKEDEVVAQIETDKVTVDVRSPVSGVIREIMAAEGDNVTVGKDLFRVEVGAQGETVAAQQRQAEKLSQSEPEPNHIEPQEEPSGGPAGSPPPPPADVEHGEEHAEAAAAQLTGRSVVQRGAAAAAAAGALLQQDEAGERRVPMSRMRRRIAERLKHAQNTAAMLTTFNECDLTSLSEMRASFKDGFEKRYGSKLGYMSAFVKASAIALEEQPEVNAVIDGDEILYRDYVLETKRKRLIMSDEGSPGFERSKPVAHETGFERLKRKSLKEPFVPIGVITTAVILGLGLRAFRRGDKQKSQIMMRYRVLAQGATVFAIGVGLLLTPKG